MGWITEAAREGAIPLVTATIDLGRIVGSGQIETETLYLATGEIEPEYQEQWHAPHVLTVPEIGLSTAALTTPGRIQQARGTLVLSKDDPALAARRPPTWNWIGRKVRLTHGFTTLATSQYRPLMVALIGDYEEGHDTITLTLDEPAQVLWARNRTAGDYAGNLPDLVSAALAEGGITNLAAASWNYWATTHNWPAWYRASGEMSIGDIVHRLAGVLGCAYFTDPELESFRILALIPPQPGETPTKTLHEWDIDGEVIAQTLTPRCYKLTVKYLTVTGDTPVYAEVSTSNNDIRALNPLAEEMVVETALTSLAGATAIRDRLWDIYSTPRTLAKIPLILEHINLGASNLVAVEGVGDHVDGNWRVLGKRVSERTNTLDVWR